VSYEPPAGTPLTANELAWVAAHNAAPERSPHPEPDHAAEAALLAPLVAKVREAKARHDAEVRATALREAARLIEDRMRAEGYHLDCICGACTPCLMRDYITLLGDRAANPAPDPWAAVARLTAWLDDHNGSSTPETALRLLKVSEEAGEVASAWIGVTGQNPRKGETHTVDDVADELCDVIVAAMVALTTLKQDPAAHFARKLAAVAALRLDPAGGES
jgi:NTP pyrophosphatase (non-canonical NTP hydrolase)